MRVFGGTTDENRDYLWTWLADRWPTSAHGFPEQPHDFRAIYHGEVVDKQLKLIAVIGFTDWTPSAASIHVASDGTGRWMTRDFVHEFHHWPFITCGLTRLHCVALDDNPAVAKVCEGLGYTRECVLRHYDGKNKHGCLYAMTFEDWAANKWNKKRAAFADPLVNTGQQDPKDVLNGQEGT